ncbi:MMS19 nucleotide excision repair protein homolog isoform X1 [Mytilus californianus]|uniref:MMS19 nucleotide excision repair protein homolog isoform X1 n=1 Tax=Mytilus californianus TaxID=6549 RepID=UPI0022480850|nr:MMS19 nucleotide excision repair protein homolog isoform X1 [Mytilus californianus]
MAAPMNLESCVQNYIENTVTDQKTTISSVTKDIVNNEVKLVTFIENLQKYLTSTDVSIRSRCVRLIAEVLHQLPNSHLNEDEVELLVTYMCERLMDHHSVQPPALYALLALSGCKNFPDGLASKICRIIFQNVQNQSLSQSDRCSVYTLIARFLDTRMEELKKMEADFVLGFIQVMDTEKDPRNLMTCFQCARTIILNFSLGVFVEEMFEVTSCYFPIDFTPPPNDNYKITRDDLIKGLRGCLSATEKFAGYTYPLLLEKLTSDVQSAKLDSLQTLIECVELYGIKPLKEFQSSLYNCIKSEMFSSGNQAIEQAALEALRGIVLTLSKSLLAGPDGPVYNYISEILQDCKRYMTGEDNRLLVPVCRLLVSCGEGSDSACCQVLQDVIPNLIGLYNKSSVNSQRKLVLEMISRFVRVVGGYSQGQCHKVFLTYIPELSTIIKSALIDSSSHLRMTGISGVKEMLKVSGEDTQVYTELILDKTFNDEDKDVRKSCLEPLKTIAEMHTVVLESTVIPKVLERLKDGLNNVLKGSEDMDNEINAVLSTVTISYNSLVMVSKELLQVLSGTSTTGMENEKTEQRTNNLVSCLLTVIQKNLDDKKSLEYLYSNVALNIYKTVIQNSLCSTSVLHSPRIINSFSRCVQCIAIRCDNSQLQALYSLVTKIFLHGSTSAIDITDGTFNPLDVSSPWQQTQVVSMVTPVICTCNEKLIDEDEYVQKLLHLSRMSPHRTTQTEACKCLAGIVNKHPDILQNIDLSDIEKTVQNKTSESRRSALQMIIWFTKALVMRGHQRSQTMILFLMSLLSDQDIGREVADGFNTILTDSDDVLNRQMKAVTRMMYKQRLFVENVSHLVKSFDTTGQDTRKNYLRVLSVMLKTLPKQVLLNELPPLFPLMVHSLLSDDLELQTSTMDTLYDLTHDAPEVVAKHIDSLIPQLLKLAKAQTSMKLRQSALQCIGVLTVLPTHTVLPYKLHVIKGLEKALDDKKRLVRKEAVTARNEWFLLGTSK